MSLGYNVYVRLPRPCALLGDYIGAVRLLDNIVRGRISGQQPICFEAASTERGLGAPCGQWGTITIPATAKNTIVVGSTNSNNDKLAGSSSMGPASGFW